MTRPLRIEFPGAVYHVTSRGDRREPIFEDDADREILLGIVGQTMERFDARMLAYLLAEPASTPTLRRRAAKRYSGLVEAARDLRLWDQGLSQQIFLGDQAFAARMRSMAAAPTVATRDIPKAQRSVGKPLARFLAECRTRDEALWRAHSEAGLTMSAMAKELNLTMAAAGDRVVTGIGL